MPQLNWKIDLGHVLTIIITLAALATSYGRLSTDVAYIKARLDKMDGLAERLVRVETHLEDSRHR